MNKNTKKKVLIIEDEKDYVAIVKTFLNKHGYDVVHAYDAVMGINAVIKENPDIILLDLGLPGGGGFSVLENIRNNDNTKQIPVVVITANEDEETEERIKKYKVEEYLMKPFCLPVLVAAVEGIIAVDGDIKEIKKDVAMDKEDMVVDQKGKSILIIEDESEYVAIIEALLRRQGYNVISAYDTAIGMKSIKKESPDLVILDLGLPGGGGFSILENIRQIEDTKDMPVIILTGMEDEDLEEQARQLGVKAYFKKPFNSPELIRTVVNILGK
jgi:DNA-binding response OmpR family regulator